MKLPLSLLKSFLEIDAPIVKIEEALSMLGIEVDAVYSLDAPFSGVVVAEVKSCRRHPSAEKLQVAEVFDGSRTYPVVCAASNCREGLRTAFAKAGARLLDEQGHLREIEKTSIRGAESEGMLCSAGELRLYEDSSGHILELPSDFPLGADCLPLLWDPVLELSLTPNLGHCMSALGIARELAAAWNKPLRKAETALQENRSRLLPFEVTIESSSLCSRYMARAIEGVKIGPSPFWLQRQLQAAGLRPVNNVVDATNYILLKFGQPLHAYDCDKLEGQSIRIAAATKPMPFAPIVGEPLEIPSGALCIFDAAKPIAIAGVMGSADTAVSETTRTILLEAASFDPSAVRSAVKKSGIRSDSSQRFEKGVDPISVARCLDEAAALIAHLSGGSVMEGFADCRAGSFELRKIHCRPEKINHLLGTKLSAGEIRELLARLEFHIEEKGGAFLVQVPSYRMDIAEEIDLVEEVARLYGYNHIERPLPLSTPPQIPNDPTYLFETQLRRRLIALGLQEFLACDLISPKLAAVAAELTLHKTQLVALHSKSEEYSVLRTSLLPGLLQIVRTNLDQKNRSLSAFEIGRIHFSSAGKIVEFPMAAIVLTGAESPRHWDEKPRDADFFQLKGILENLLQGLRIAATFTPSAHPTFHPGRQADLMVRQTHLGSFGELHPNLLARFDIKQKVYYAEINAQYAADTLSSTPKFSPLAQFPSSERDWTLPIDATDPIARLFDAIRGAHSPLLERFDLIDYYPAGEKINVTFRFVYRDRSKTVSFEEVEAAHAHLMQEVLAKTHSSR